MKKIHRFLLLLILLTISLITNCQTTRTVGPGGNYTTLRAAFIAINAGTITGEITLQITGSITETGSAVLNANGSGSTSYSSVTIYPTMSGLSVTGSLTPWPCLKPVFCVHRY